MLIKTLRFQSSLLAKNYPRVLCTRSYTNEKSNKNRGSTGPASGINKFNIFGTLGIGAALLGSYFVVRNNNDIDTDNINFLKGKNKTAIPDQALLVKPGTTGAEGEEKDEHLRTVPENKYDQPFDKTITEILETRN